MALQVWQVCFSDGMKGGTGLPPPSHDMLAANSTAYTLSRVSKMQYMPDDSETGWTVYVTYI